LHRLVCKCIFIYKHQFLKFSSTAVPAADVVVVVVGGGGVNVFVIVVVVNVVVVNVVVAKIENDFFSYGQI
jgi:hypothetical protein